MGPLRLQIVSVDEVGDDGFVLTLRQASDANATLGDDVLLSLNRAEFMELKAYDFELRAVPRVLDKDERQALEDEPTIFSSIALAELHKKRAATQAEDELDARYEEVDAVYGEPVSVEDTVVTVEQQEKIQDRIAMVNKKLPPKKPAVKKSISVRDQYIRGQRTATKKKKKQPLVKRQVSRNPLIVVEPAHLIIRQRDVMNPVANIGAPVAGAPPLAQNIRPPEARFG